MNTNRKIAMIAGILYIVATVAGILSLGFTQSILDMPDYLINVAANKSQVIAGEFFALIMAVAIVGIPITLYPVLKRHNESIAIGYFGARLAEGFVFIISIISVLTLLTLSQEFVEAGAPIDSYFQTLGDMLVVMRGAGHVGIFPLSALMFYYLLYQSKLVPRWLSGWGLIGAVLYLASDLLIMFTVITSFSTIRVGLVMPLALQEMVLAVWLIFKGFNLSAISSGYDKIAVKEEFEQIKV